MRGNDRAALHKKDVLELKTLLKEARGALFTHRMEQARGKQKNTRVIFHKRKDIARVQTVLRAKKLLEERKP